MKAIWGFIQNNWLYFTIGAALIVLLLLVIIIVAVKHNRKKKKIKQNEIALQKAQETEKQQEVEMPPNADEELAKDETDLSKADSKKINVSEKVDGPVSLEALLELMKEKSKEDKLHQSENLIQALASIESESHKEDDRVENLRKLLLSRQLELEQEKREIEALKNLNQELDDDGEEQRKAEQLELLSKLVSQREEEQRTLLREISQDKELAKEISDRNYLNALNEILNPSSKEDETEQPDIVINQPKEDVHIEVSEEVDEDEDDDEDDDSNTKRVSKNAVVLENLKKLTLKEAYEQLTKTQKQYFNKLRDYADKKPDSKAKETVRYVTVGCGNKSYIKLSIKKKVVIASFVLESEEMQRLRLSKKSDIKPEETKIRVVDDEAFAMAKQMIDIRVTQVAKEKEIVKELRKAKQKDYVNLKKKKK